MLKMLPITIVSLILLRRSMKLYQLTAYNLFFLGSVLFLQVGFMMAFIDPYSNYVLRGDTALLDNVYSKILVFWMLSAAPLFFQKSFPSASDPASVHTQKALGLYQLFIVFILCFLMVGVNIAHAPLFKIGSYTFEEMSEARSQFYGGAFSQATAVVRYLMLYLMVPSLFFLKGYGLNVNRFPLFLGILISLLTLSKTGAILLIVFYYFGRYSQTEKYRHLLYMFLASGVAFYAIVFSSYFVSEKRELIEVSWIFLKRLIVMPVSLAAFYASNFAFLDGVRGSSVYVHFFGGRVDGISKIAGALLTGVPDTHINAPAGIIGMAYPNVPEALHTAYFLVIILFVAVVSWCASSISNSTLRKIMSVLFGVSCWFMLLTDPLTALNSYGGLYISVIVFALYFSRKMSDALNTRAGFYHRFSA